MNDPSMPRTPSLKALRSWNALTIEARRSMNAAIVFLDDGAPADALKCLLQASNVLYALVCNRYIP